MRKSTATYFIFKFLKQVNKQGKKLWNILHNLARAHLNYFEKKTIRQILCKIPGLFQNFSKKTKKTRTFQDTFKTPGLSKTCGNPGNFY